MPGFIVGDFAKVAAASDGLVEEFEEVCPEDRTFIDPLDFQNSWVNYGMSRNLCYWLDKFHNIIHVEGIIKDGSAGLVYTLPVGYRPTTNYYFCIPSFDGVSYGTSYGYVAANGQIQIPSLFSNVLVDLNLSLKI